MEPQLTELTPEQIGQLDYAQHEAWRHTGKLPDEKAAGGEKPAGEEKQTQPEGEKPAEKPQETEEQRQAKKEGGFQRKIRKLEEENATLRGRLEATSELAGKPAGDKPKETAAKAKPKEEDFATWAEFNDALVNWTADQRIEQRLAEQRRADQKARETEAVQARETVWKQQVEKAAAKHEDWEQVFEDTEALLTPAMTEALKDSELGAELAYELAKNPAEAARIGKLSPFAQVREIGKLEAKLQKPPEPKTKKASEAPEPIKPLGGSKSGVDLNDDKVPFEDWEKHRNSQLRAR